MDYFGVIKKAYEITIKNKFLWIFGIFVAGTGGSIASFGPSFNYQTPPSSSSDLTMAQFEQKLVEFWASFGHLVLIGMALILLVGLIFFIFGIISQGALIGSVDKIDRGEKTDFKIGFKLGAKNFWRVWGVAIVYLMFILASLCLLIIPAAIFALLGIYALAISWAVLMLFVCVVFWLLIAAMAPYSTIIVVLEKISVWGSIREPLHLFRQKWTSMIVMYLILMAIGMAYGMVIMLAFLILGGIAFAIGAGLWLASLWAAIIYGFGIGLLAIIILVIVNGAFKSFGSAVLTLTYNRLKKTA